MLLNVYVSDLKRLANGKVLMTSGDSAYNDCISFEIEETDYKLTMSGDEAWYADIDEEFFIKLCKQLMQQTEKTPLQAQHDKRTELINRLFTIEKDMEVIKAKLEPPITNIVLVINSETIQMTDCPSIIDATYKELAQRTNEIKTEINDLLNPPRHVETNSKRN